jgi:LPS sulfotransferase NodH
LEQVFPEPRFVWVSRRDVLAEAVSWWKAHLTGDWWRERTADPPPPPAVPFDFDEIDRLVGEIVEGNEIWQRWFAANGIEPLHVVYEELDTDREGGVTRVLRLLDARVTEGLAIAEQSARQSDALNEEWIARYRARAGA